jgi:hypothetical protein
MKIKVEFIQEIPDGTPDNEIEEWLLFNIGGYGGMSEKNSLAGKDLEAKWMSMKWRKE